MRPKGRSCAFSESALALPSLVGNTIGSGILRVPGEIAGHLPSVTLFLGVWIAGGIYALLGSNALAKSRP